MSTNKTIVTKDVTAKKITVSREFNAPVSLVWRAYTDSEILDQWWGPSPWKAKTKSMDFREGGQWLYVMTGPENEAHWSLLQYQKINTEKDFSAKDAFCDENGNINTEMPGSEWFNRFIKTDNGTEVVAELSFETREQMDQLIKMGFEEGFKQGLEQLEALLPKL